MNVDVSVYYKVSHIVLGALLNSSVKAMFCFLIWIELVRDVVIRYVSVVPNSLPLLFLQCTTVHYSACHRHSNSALLTLSNTKQFIILLLTLTTCVKGYHGDLNETFFVGKVDKKSLDLVECAFRSLSAAIAIVKPGTLYR